jgi:rhodanese-related sulfurtransferase
MDIYILSVLISLIIVIILGLIYYTYSSKYLISSSLAKLLLNKKIIDVVIDVRTDIEWNAGHYVDAIHIKEINENNLKNINKDSLILVYCNTGQRARIATNKIRDLGFNNVYYIAGSYATLK